jgi:prevent-host-death family protein
MTMVRKKKRTVPAGEFRDKCLGLFDEVQRTGKEVIVTKRGKPVAGVVPVEPAPALVGNLGGKILGDIISPIDVKWDANE